MINLLPKYWQKKISDEEMYKAVVILGVVSTAALLSFVLMLWVVQVFFTGQLKAEEVIAHEKEQEMEIYEVAKGEKDIERYNDLAGKLEGFYKKQTKITEIFPVLAESLPMGVTLQSFGYNSGKINITGFSPDRASLSLLKEKLDGNSKFKDVVFPSENWIKSQNINFNASFNIVTQ